MKTTESLESALLYLFIRLAWVPFLLNINNLGAERNCDCCQIHSLDLGGHLLPVLQHSTNILEAVDKVHHSCPTAHEW